MDEELKRRIEGYLTTSKAYEQWDDAMSVYNSPPKRVYQTSNQVQLTHSLAEVQLTGGRMIGMMISASTTLGAHLTKSMKETGFLYLYNDSESLMIRADEVVAIKLTQMTKGE